MKKQFQQIKNFVQDIKDINLNSRDRHDVLSVELQNAEKRLELIKQVCQSSEKKISACLQLLPSGQLSVVNSGTTQNVHYHHLQHHSHAHNNNNSFTERNLNQLNGHLTLGSVSGSANFASSGVSLNTSLSSNSEDLLIENLLEKKQKKLPEVQLHQTLQELSDLFPPDSSILGVTLRESGEIQKQLSKELLRYEQDVERLCLSPLQDILENDIPTLTKARKTLQKSMQEVETLKQKVNQAVKSAQQQNGPQTQIKVDTLRRELDEANQRMIQSRDGFAHDLHAFLSREAEFSCIYVQLFKLRANYHKNVLDIIESNMPNLESAILNTSQKPLFGTSLEESAKETGRDLSLVLECCVHELMQHLDEEGLFRVPGSSSKLKKLRTLFNLNAGAKQPPAELLTQLQHDPHSVAGCLKSYLRELPEPLLSYAMYQPLLAAARISDSSQRLTSLWQLVQQLPPVHALNLRFLIKFLAKLASHSEQNKMNAQNIAIAIAPSLIWAPADRELNGPPNMDMCAANQYGIIIDALVTHADWFFPGDIELESLFFPDRPKSADPFLPSTIAPRAASRNKKPAPPVPDLHAPISSSTPNRSTNSDRKARDNLSEVMPSSVVNAPRSTLHTQNFDPVRVNSAEPSDLESGTSSESKTSCSSSNCSSNEQLDQPDHDRPKGSAEHRLSNGPMRSHSISPTNSTDRFVGVRSGGGSLDRRSSRPFALHHNPLPASSTNERRAVATGPNVGSGLRHCVSSASANMPPLCSTSHAWRTASNRSSLSSNSSGVYRDRPQSVHHIERPSFPPPDAPIRSTNESNAKSTESINSNGNSSASEDPQSHVQSSKGLFTTFSANRLDQPLLNESNHRVNFSTFKPQPEVRAHRTNSSSPSHRVTTLTTTITGNGSLSIDSYERKAPELPVKPPELLQRLQESASARQQANESVSNENINEPIGSNKVPPEIPARPTDIPTRFAPEKPPRSSTTHTTQSNATFNDISTGSLVSCIEIDGKSVEKDRDSYDSNTSERIRPPRPQPPNYKPRLTTEHTHL